LHAITNHLMRRGIPGMPIYGVGMPTVQGVRGVLRSVSGSSSPGAGRRVNALWVNMREEPMVYINGKPFVLREEVRRCACVVV